MLKPYWGSGCNVTMDNWFTSILLAFQLWEIKLTLCGTIRKNKRELAPQFVSTKNRAVFSTISGHLGIIKLASYCPKPIKFVNLISTKHDSINFNEEDAKKKPNLILLYNKNKGGVDVLDYLCNEYSTKRKTRRWPHYLFQGLLNILAVNSYILYKSGNVYISRRLYLRQLGKSLCIENKLFRNLSFQHPSTSIAVKRRKCYFCVTNEFKKTNNLRLPLQKSFKYCMFKLL
ncbi:hypothetical protein A3Q56_01213 [Intoshia linei]|uniref:PiggyBac transposable element-derived protein domain-containing protein n=1 Tax=Intoshia linei TaxID=1819745 RepID=A0A177BBG1_9BILA|nr:hypothetical protein A3Q56_01213 [Intoshia linei]